MDRNICLNCFQAKGEFEVCPFCGYVEGTPPEQAYYLHPGVVLQGRYVVGVVIGFGGFGATYKAYDAQLGIIVAVKEFYPSGLVSRVPGEKQVVIFSGEKQESFQAGLSRFLEEAKNTAKFRQHPNIVNVLTFFEENNTAYIVMEFLDGMNLSAYLKQKEKLSPQEAADIVTPVTEALTAIHNAGIIHRDIHPANIFITVANQVKVIDFGAAKFSKGQEVHVSDVVVTPGYASPEQYQSKSRQGPFTDIYGLGATFYKMVTGETPEEAIDRQHSDQLKKPSALGVEIDNGLDKAIMKAMALKPDLRFRTAAEFQSALTGKKNIDFPEIEFKKRRFRRTVAVLALTVGFLGLLGAVGYYLNHRPIATLASIRYGSDPISVWVPLRGDSGEQQKQQESYEAIKTKFEEEFAPELAKVPVTVDYRFIPEEEYDLTLTEALESKEGPDLFASGDFSGDLSRYGASLDMLLLSIPLDSYYFLPAYDTYYASALEIPTAFHAPLLYGNIYAIEEAGQTQIAEITSWDDLVGRGRAMGLSENGPSGLFALYGDDLVRGGKITIGEEDRRKITQAGTLFAAGEEAASMARADELLYWAGHTGDLRNVQNMWAGYYAVVPMSNEGHMAGFAADSWAVSKTAPKNRQNLAMLFLVYLLQDYAQDALYLQNNLAIPMNKTIFDQYIAGNPQDLGFLPERMESVAFVGEDSGLLKRFGRDVYAQVYAKGLSESQGAAYLEQYWQ
jgi:serine/threonine protein kinase